jgi:hypothetical protein
VKFVFNPRRWVWSVSLRFQSPGHLQPTEVGLVCVAAISIAGAVSPRFQSPGQCHHDFNRLGNVAAIAIAWAMSPRFPTAEASSTRGFCLQPAEAGFVCLAAVSNRRGLFNLSRILRINLHVVVTQIASPSLRKTATIPDNNLN